MANTTSQINAAKLSTNFFIIREVYGYMASIDKIKKAKEKFYKYLDITPTRYDKIVEEGIGNIDPILVEKLVECGFSDTLFRRDSATRIKMSKALSGKVDDYLLYKTITLPEFHDFLAAEIGSVQNTDNTLLVVSVRRLISKIQADPDVTLENFMDILDDLEFEDHYLQKDLITEIKDLHKQYNEILKGQQNEE